MKEDRNIEDEKIDKLIRESLRFDKSPEGLTGKIMQHIQATDQQEEAAMTSVMKKYATDSPSADFTSKVMARIEASTSISVNPVIIGKKAWIFILTALTAFVVFVLSSGGAAETEPVPAVYTDYLGRIANLFNQVEGSFSIKLPEILTNPVFGLSLFALSSLLLIDHMLKSRKLSVV
jgi:hypothetical protein